MGPGGGISIAGLWLGWRSPCPDVSRRPAASPRQSSNGRYACAAPAPPSRAVPACAIR